MKVYKYMLRKNAIDAMKNGIYAGDPSGFNDPYESEGIAEPSSFRVCCLASSWKQVIMWAYYGYHRECCMEFEIPDDVEIVKKVNYNLNELTSRDLSRQEVFNKLYSKDREWKHENEIRIVFDKKNFSKELWTVDGDSVYFIATPRRIMFGLRTDFKDNETQRLLKQLRDINAKKEKEEQIEVLHAMISQSKYEISVDKQFCFTDKISIL